MFSKLVGTGRPIAHRGEVVFTVSKYWRVTMGSVGRAIARAVWMSSLTLMALSAMAGTRPGGMPTGDALLLHGHIYTADPAKPWVEALAVRGGRIVAAGTEAQARRVSPSGVKVIDLRGRTVVPGFIDAHMHLLFGAMEIAGLNLSSPERSLTPEHSDDLAAALSTYAARHPGRGVLIARGDFASMEPMAPNHQLLDRAVPARPLVIHNSTEHSLWVNAAALTLAGIGEEPLADPAEEKGVIRDASGHPTGVLLEAAQETMERAVLASLSIEDKLALLQGGMRYLNTFGITSVVNATGDLAEIELYGQLRDRGALTVRTKTAFGAVAVPHRLTPKFLDDLETARTRFHDEWVSANLVKFFADGSTGLAPPLVYRARDYKAMVAELDRRGFQIMTHAQRGDSVHLALDAYDAAIRQNGARDRRFRIEHDFVISDADLTRYPALQVIAGIQPAFCCSELGTNYDPADSTPADRWHGLLAGGAVLAFSTDWPCMWPPDPFVNIQQAVTRQIWKSEDTAGIETAPFDGARQGGAKPLPGRYFHPEERISVRESVDGYTRFAAYAEFAEDRVGMLSPGKLADLAVLSQDIFAVDPQSIETTRAILTMVGGRVVYGDEHAL
jgi:predicted amidohydrolase YtcJ